MLNEPVVKLLLRLEIAITAAAIGDAPGVAAVLDRIVSDERALRYWMLEVYGETGGMLLQGRRYPFIGIVDKPAVAAARQRVDAAYARLRAAGEAALAGLL